MHTFVEPLVDEICRQLAPFASETVDLKQRLPFANRYHIQVEPAKNGKEVRFRFMTHDEFEMNFDVNFIELRRGGQAYLDNGFRNMLAAMQSARKHRQQQTAQQFESVASLVHYAVNQPNPETRH